MPHSFKSHFFTGLIVLLPISLLVAVVVWLYRIIDAIIAPFAHFYDAPALITNLLVLVAVVIVVFLVGVSARTRPGEWFFDNLDRHVFFYLPGYNAIKRLLKPFLGEGYKRSFRSVALVDIWDNWTLMTAFITDKTDGYTTVFVPTGPNPTSGNIYHIPDERVRVVDVRVESVLQSVISVGAGSRKLIERLEKKG